MAKISTHTGSRALRATSDDDGNISLMQSCEECSLEDAADLEDDDYEPLDENAAVARLLEMLAALAGPDDKFVQFMAAINSGDREEALRLLRLHDEETGEFRPGSKEEEAFVDSELAAAAREAREEA